MSSSVCRVCLVGKVKMVEIKEKLQETYGNLSRTRMNIKQNPTIICYICYHRLKMCQRFSEMAQTSENILIELFQQGINATNLTLRLDLRRQYNLSISPVKYSNISDMECFDTFETVKLKPAASNNYSTIIAQANEFGTTLIQSRDIAKNICNETIFQNAPDTDIIKLKNVTCKCCAKHFSCNSSLERHMRIHTGEKPFSCQQCDKRFALQGNLTAHVRIHTGKKRFTCEKCTKTFYSHSHLVRHMRSHTKEKNYTCNYCDKTFYSSSDKVKHTRIHTGEKPFKCEQCKKTFCEQSNMIKHVRLHTGEKLFTCEKCGKNFSQQSNLIRHIQIHSGEKPYKCKQCDKKFTCKASLMKHTQVHTGEKPYICNICGNCFTQKCYLLLHVCTCNNKSTA